MGIGVGAGNTKFVSGLCCGTGTRTRTRRAGVARVLVGHARARASPSVHATNARLAHHDRVCLHGIQQQQQQQRVRDGAGGRERAVARQRVRSERGTHVCRSTPSPGRRGRWAILVHVAVPPSRPACTRTAARTRRSEAQTAGGAMRQPRPASPAAATRRWPAVAWTVTVARRAHPATAHLAPAPPGTPPANVNEYGGKRRRARRPRRSSLHLARMPRCARVPGASAPRAGLLGAQWSTRSSCRAGALATSRFSIQHTVKRGGTHVHVSSRRRARKTPAPGRRCRRVAGCAGRCRCASRRRVQQPLACRDPGLGEHDDVPAPQHAPGSCTNAPADHLSNGTALPARARQCAEVVRREAEAGDHAPDVPPTRRSDEPVAK